MKIGILTFHNVPNYGAALQAFALKTYLSELGNTVGIIDYQCPGNSDEFKPDNRRKSRKQSKNALKGVIKSALYSMFADKDYTLKYDRFCDFFNKHYFSVKYTDDIYNSFDAVFCGSDQIWNPSITNGFKLPYFGGKRDGKTLAVSYAASCGDINELSDDLKADFFSYVRKLDFVGVREQGLYDVLLAQGIDCNCTVDPTFLLSQSDYIKKLNLKRTDSSKYLLQYSLQKNSALDEMAERAAEEKGLKVVNICGYIPYEPKGKRLFDVGPVEFLQYLYNAEYVVTDSFHGVALSINFQKDFNACMPKLRKGRISDLLEALSLNDRIYSEQNGLVTDSINYADVNKRLEKAVSSSKLFISEALGSRK